MGVLALTDDQRRALERHVEQTLAALAKDFDIDTTESQRRFSWGMRIASALGAAALCAAVFFFFYRFWGLLGTPAQLTLLVATPIALVLAAEFAARRERTLYIAALISVVAFAAFILNLNMVGFIFGMTPSPAAFLAWGLFALALAYHFRLRLLLMTGLICLVIWLGGMVTGWAGAFWGAMLEASEPLILAGALVLAAPLAARHRARPDFPPVYRFTGLAVIFLAMLAPALKLSVSWLGIPDRHVPAVYQVAGMLLSAGAIWMGIRRGFTGVVNLSAGAFVIFLYCRLVAWWWDWMPRYLFFLIIGLISLALLVVFRKLRPRLTEAT